MSNIIESMLETAKELRMEPITIKEIELLKLAEIKTMESSEIKEMRIKEKVSQSVMARVFNVTPSTWQKWERGEVCPKGSNLKLLRLAYDHGLNYILS